jgi:hypothetical protein
MHAKWHLDASLPRMHHMPKNVTYLLSNRLMRICLRQGVRANLADFPSLVRSRMGLLDEMLEMVVLYGQKHSRYAQNFG